MLSISGEKLSAPSQLVQPFKEKLMNKIKELHLNEKQIYNGGETSLYWKLLPAKTYVVASHKESAPGRKPEKPHNFSASGTHEIRPPLIGKANNPRLFRNVNNFVDCNCFRLDEQKHNSGMVPSALWSWGMAIKL